MMIRLRDRRTWVGRSAEAGAIALISAILVPVLLILVAFAADIGRWYVEVAKVQKAADAAALAGVTWMPADFTTATSKATTMAGLNGYTDQVSPTAYPQVAVLQGDRPSELLVTVTSRVNNSFARIFGLPTTVISRSALADYVAPAIMGSPCNALGNQPSGSTGGAQPQGTVIPTVAQGGFATCQTDANFWMNMFGPNTNKENGDRYAARFCNNGNTACTGGSNDEYKPDGYIYVVRVAQAAVGTPINLQLYDPAFVQTGDDCGQIPGPITTPGNQKTQWRDMTNAYTTTTGDRDVRYAATPNDYCPGDNNPGGVDHLNTSFVLRGQTDTYDPLQGVPIAGCAKQYASLRANYPNDTGALAVPTPSQLTRTIYASNNNGNNTTVNNPGYADAVARVFHQWVPFCTFTPPVAGDYYLQMRTNVPLAAKNTGLGDDDMTRNISNAAVITNPVTLDNNGGGFNRFAIRAYIANTALASKVSVAGYERMSIYMNAAGAQATFNLLQVLPNAAGRAISFEAFDLGDATQPGTVTVNPPLDARATSGVLTWPDCVFTGPTANNPSACSFVAGPALQGKVEAVTRPIPGNYACGPVNPANLTAGDCWFTVRMNFPNSVADTTTWNANIGGDPVRLLR